MAQSLADATITPREVELCFEVAREVEAGPANGVEYSDPELFFEKVRRMKAPRAKPARRR